MQDQNRLTKAELLQKIEDGWQAFNAYLMTLTPVQMTVPTDAAGWTALDHVLHLSVWEDGITALLNHQNRSAAMGIDPATWESRDFDAMNALIQQRTKTISLPEAHQQVMTVHQQLFDKVKSLSEEDLYRPYNFYDPADKRDIPVIEWVIADTYGHYEEHTPWIKAIVESPIQMSKAELLLRVGRGWDRVNDYLGTLSLEQLTTPTDAGGWTVKDHVIHMAIWEDGMIAVLNGIEPADHMNIDKKIWEQGDDPINAVIQQRYRDATWADVQHKREAIHANLLQKINSLSEAELNSSLREFLQSEESARQVWDSISGSTYLHYEEHLPWMRAIARS